jgi:hypothetical protein
MTDIDISIVMNGYSQIDKLQNAFKKNLASRFIKPLLDEMKSNYDYLLAQTEDVVQQIYIKYAAKDQQIIHSGSSNVDYQRTINYHEMQSTINNYYGVINSILNGWAIKAKELNDLLEDLKTDNMTLLNSMDNSWETNDGNFNDEQGYDELYFE